MHTPHELSEVFPEQHDLLHKLKVEDAHFARLSTAYHSLNREIHRAETNVEPVADTALENLKKRRLVLLDEIKGMLAQATSAA